MPPSGETFAYGDLGDLFGTNLISNVIASGLESVRDALAPEAKACLLEWSHSVREIAVWGKGGGGIAIATFDPRALKTPVSTCIERLGGPPPGTTKNSGQTYDFGDEILVLLPDMALFGTRSLVEMSLAGDTRSQWPAQLVLQPEQQFAFMGNEKDRLEIGGSLSVSEDHFTARSDIAFKNPDEAQELADVAAPDELKRKLLDTSPQLQSLAPLLSESWHVERHGNKVSFDFTLKGSPSTLTYNLGIVSALGAYGTRQYLTNSKTAEARATVGRIAKDMAAYVYRENMSDEWLHAKAQPGNSATRIKRLISLPPVPADFELIRAKKYQSTSADWAKWAPIKFELESPQRYQFRVEAAKDGLSAEIIAEGDLDGNGIKSRFSIKMKLDPKSENTITMDPQFYEQSPEE